jgi:hypothetical protein
VGSPPRQLTGRVKVKVEPRPTSLCTQRVVRRLRTREPGDRGVTLASVRRDTAGLGFRLASFGGVADVTLGSREVGFGGVSSRQNCLILSVMRMSRIVYLPLLASSVIAVSVTPGGISRSGDSG